MTDYRLELRLYAGAAPPSPSVPTLQNITMRRGAETLAGAGGVPLGQLMQVGGDPITSWSMSGDVTGLAISAATGAITPTAHGAVGTATRTIEITGTNALGLGVGYITLIGVPMAYSVSRSSEVTSTQLSTPARKAAMGGKTIMFSRGMLANLTGTRDTITFNLYNTHAAETRITVTSEFEDSEEKWTRLHNVQFNAPARIDIRKLRLQAYLPADNTASNLQAAGQLRILRGTGGVRSRDTTARNLICGAPVELAPLVRQWVAGVECSEADNCEITDVRVVRCYGGLKAGECFDCTFERFSIDRYTLNAYALGGLTNSRNTSRDFMVGRGYSNPLAMGNHLDAMQIGDLRATEGYDDNIFENFRIYAADGNSLPQGPFYNDVGRTNAAYTGRGQNNTIIRNVFYQGGKFTGPSLDVGQNWTVFGLTCIRQFREWTDVPNAENGSQGGGYGTGPSVILDPQVNSYPWGDSIGTTATIERCVAMTVDADVEAGDPSVRANNSFLINDKLGPLPASVQGATQNDADLAAYFAQAFEDPDTVGVDWASMTLEEIDSLMRLKYSPKIGGPLDRGDGTFDGMWGPGGVLNEGQAFY